THPCVRHREIAVGYDDITFSRHMVVMTQAILRSAESSNICGVEGLGGQRQLIENNFSFGERQGCQYAIAQLLRRNVPLNRKACRFPITFIGCKEHRSIPDDGSTERSAELIELDRRLGRRAGQERIASRKRVALIVLECRTMEL